MKIASISPTKATSNRLGDTPSAAFDFAYGLKRAVWIYDIDNTRVIRANDAACDLWGASDELELASRDMSADMSPMVAKRLSQYQTDFSKSDASFTELWTLYPNGRPQSVMVVYSGYRLADGRMAMQCEVVGDAEDAPQNLRSAEALLHTDVMIMLFDCEGPSLYLNPAARNALGGPVEQVRGLFAVPEAFDALLSELSKSGEQRQLTRLKTEHGISWFDLSVKKCSDAATGRPALLMTAIDVTELKEARDTARTLADRDQLTNLHNRSYLQHHLAALEQMKKAVGTTVVVFDIDRFKQFNDGFGHEAGDTLLRQIALRTRAVLTPDDLIARLGGDEFVIILEGERSQADLEKQLDHLLRAGSRPVMHGETRLDATISIGVSKVTKTAPTFKAALREADIALYTSKKCGRNRVTVFDAEMGRAVIAREKLEAALRKAVAGDEFELYYQPRLDVQSGKIVGAEGLIRWHRPGHGMVLPATFIPVCEETGLIDQVGQLVLEMGCAQAIAWQRSGLDLGLSLNVSPRQFAHDGFLDTLGRLAAQADFPTGRVELEITESVLIGDPVQVAGKLRKITRMGYKIAIDDFGTGYSNLSYITQFPLRCLKIDRSFIQQLPASGPVVQLILTLAEQIGVTVVSEGVETPDQLTWLKDNNCAQAQGFLITEALPIEDFERFAADFSVTQLGVSS